MWLLPKVLSFVCTCALSDVVNVGTHLCDTHADDEAVVRRDVFGSNTKKKRTNWRVFKGGVNCLPTAEFCLFQKAFNRSGAEKYTPANCRVLVIDVYKLQCCNSFLSVCCGVRLLQQLLTVWSSFICWSVLMIYSDTNSMVEEFMLLANIYTAQKTLEEFPQCAVLRRHPAPPQSNYEPLIKVAEAKVSYIISLYASCLSRWLIWNTVAKLDIFQLFNLIDCVKIIEFFFLIFSILKSWIELRRQHQQQSFDAYFLYVDLLVEWCRVFQWMCGREKVCLIPSMQPLYRRTRTSIQCCAFWPRDAWCRPFTFAVASSPRKTSSTMVLQHRSTLTSRPLFEGLNIYEI